MSGQLDLSNVLGMPAIRIVVQSCMRGMHEESVRADLLQRFGQLRLKGP
jgi:hypothetical protein